MLLLILAFEPDYCMVNWTILISRNLTFDFGKYVKNGNIVLKIKYCHVKPGQ